MGRLFALKRCSKAKVLKYDKCHIFSEAAVSRNLVRAGRSLLPFWGQGGRHDSTLLQLLLLC